MSCSSFSEFNETPQVRKPQRQEWNTPDRPSGSKKGRERNSTGRCGTHATPGVESSKPSRSRARGTSGKRSLEDERVWHDGELLRKSEVLHRLLGSASTAACSGGDSENYDDVDDEVQRVCSVPTGRRLFFDEGEDTDAEDYSGDVGSRNLKWDEDEKQKFYQEELERHQNIIEQYRRKIREQRQETDNALQAQLVSDSRYNELKAEHEALHKQHCDLQRVCEEQQRAQQKLGEELCERERQVEELLEKNEELQSELFESQGLNGEGPPPEACPGGGKRKLHEEAAPLKEEIEDPKGHVGVTPERRSGGQPISEEMQNVGLPCWTSIRAQSPFVFAHPNDIEESVKCTPEGRKQQNFFRCSQTSQRDVFGMASQLSPLIPPPSTPPAPKKQAEEEIQDLKNQVSEMQRRIDALGEVVEPIPAQIAEINAILNDKENVVPDQTPPKASHNRGSPKDCGEPSPWTKDVTDVVCDRIVDRLSSLLNMELHSNAESSIHDSQQRSVLLKETHPETPAPRSTNAGRGPNASALSSGSGATGKSPWSDGVEVSRVNRQEMWDLHKRLTWQMQSVKYQNRSPPFGAAPLRPSGSEGER
ncbi:hypothetical protein BSKO_03906 [Bryopsis sp. KO-2023]|nr:hypothetical protein BSKO_03906 [Bryopsis sp. KO-2023]